MPEPKIVTASLEGAQVVIDDGMCHLKEYDFSVNQWVQKETAAWPMPRAVAKEWLNGWNNVDGFAALNALIGPQDDSTPSRPFPPRTQVKSADL